MKQAGMRQIGSVGLALALGGLLGPAVQAQQATGAGTTPAAAPAAAAPAGATSGQVLLPGQSSAAPLPSPFSSVNIVYPGSRGFVRTDSFFVYPFAGVGLGYNSNPSAAQSGGSGSMLGVLGVRLLGSAKTGASVFELGYTGNYGHYFESSKDDFNNHELVGRASRQFSARTDVEGSLYWLHKTDPRGVVAQQVVLDQPNQWSALGGTLTAGYGAREAKGRFELDLGLSDKTYTNNRAYTTSLDVTSMNVAGRFYYRWQPRTRVFTELRAARYDYQLSTSLSDNTEYRAGLGVTWDATAVTSGTVRIGWMNKDFNSAAVKDYTGLYVDALLRWAPKTYSWVDLIANYGAQDTSGVGTYSVTSALAAAWTHKWRNHFQTRALLSAQNSDFRNVVRTDRLYTIGYGGFYDLRSWLRLGLEATYQNRQSTDDVWDFDRSILMFTVGGTL